MACVIDATVGGTDANSYATIAEGNTYHDNHPYPDTWLDADDDQKCRALVTATRLLDTWYEWVGTVASSDQALLWPREDAYGPNGYLHLSDEIPTRIKDATCELARQLLDSNRTADSDVETQGIESMKLGTGMVLSFKGAVTAKPIPDSVQVMVGHYGRQLSRSGNAAGGTVTLLRG